MSSVSSASSDFINALQRGLDAYDAGNTTEAARRFDEAVAIDPQNVWGLLWKGATASDPADSREWLLKVLTIDPDNEHAQAGLMWLDQTGPGDAAAAKAIVAAATLGEGQRSLPAELSAQAAPRGEQDEGPGELPAWLLGTPDPGSEEASLPEWMHGLDEPDLPAQEEPVVAARASLDDTPLPAWMRGEQVTASDVPAASSTQAPPISLPEWLRGDAPEEEVPLPEWLLEDVPEEETPQAEARAAEPAVSEEAERPAWWRDEGARAASAEDEGLPAWLRDEGPGAESVEEDERPAWLRDAAVGEGPAEDEFEEDESFSPAVELNGDEGAITALPPAMGVRETDDDFALPAWLRGDDEEEEPQAEPSARLDGGALDAQAMPDVGLVEELDASPAVESAEPSDDYPEWLRDDAPAVESTTISDVDGEGVLPAWLSGEEVVSARRDEGADTEWPDWIDQDLGGEAADEDATGRLPGWVPDEPSDMVGDDEGPVVATTGADVPDWLTGEEEEAGSIVDPATLSYAEHQALYQSGLEAYDEDRLDEAIDAFEQVAVVEGENVELYNYLGSAYFLADKPQQAIQAFEHAIATDPAYTESYLNLGLVYKETGESDRAIELFERYLEQEQDDQSTVGYVREILEEMR